MHLNIFELDRSQQHKAPPYYMGKEALLSMGDAGNSHILCPKAAEEGGRRCQSPSQALDPAGRREHILNEDAVALLRVIDHNVRHGPHQLPVLEDGRSAHE